MRKCLQVLLLFFVLSPLAAQVVTTEPFFVTEGVQVTITFNADQGTKGLMNFTGDVYAHTGVITDKSTSNSDWKYVVANWGVNVAKAKLTRISTNTYQLVMPTDIRTYYNVPAAEKILKLAFVFRSSAQVNGAWLEGKDTGGKDIFIDVYEPQLSAEIAVPLNGALFQPGEQVNVTGKGMSADGLRLYYNDELVASTQDLTLNYSFNAPASGSHTLKLEAYKGTEIKDHSISFYIRESVQNLPRPAGLRLGANHQGETSITFVLQAPHKNYVYVLGDFNNWEPVPSAQMNKDGEYFWLTIDNLESNTEYAYQYYIDGQLRIADPYTNKVLDPWNDKYISDLVYPNLKPYPENKADGIVSVVHTSPAQYQWNTTQFNPPAKKDLVIYEVLIRDFTANGDIKTITDTLDYLVRLGVNAIELMPFNEFEGNDSWGYNPSFYFATDKAYGTAYDYKAFIDACHSRGIAVIMDMVLNHSYGQSPLALMYLDGGKPAANNPWYNREHNMQNTAAQWGYDFNHESNYTKALVDSILSYWMTEFRIDGFRFDFTKGFTNTVYGPSSWASEYDAGRIALLKRMADEIWKRKENAIVIFEHLSDNVEERELADYGILMWGNHNHNFSEAVMGYHDGNKSNFSWASYKQRTWQNPHIVGYMESHDEERITYKALTYGRVVPEYSVKEPYNAIKRKGTAAVFLFSIPGPKMIWQFGELGYDISIDNGGRLGKKPPKWEYKNDPDRAQLFNVYAHMIQLKKTEPVFATTDFSMNVAESVKRIALNYPGNDVRLVGNFDVELKTVAPAFSSTGWWYNHFRGDSIMVTDINQQVTLAPGNFYLFSKKKMAGFEVISSVKPKPEEVNKSVVFPNPVRETLFIQSEAIISEIMVVDMNGSLKERYNVSGQQTALPVNSWKKGVYIVKILFADGKLEHHKIIR